MRKLTSISFVVVTYEDYMNEKKELENLYVNNIKLKIPSSSNLPEISIYDKKTTESLIFTGIKYCLGSGDCVFDFGIYSGIITSLMTKWVGKNGSVYSFDSDKESLENANEIAKANSLENNIKFHRIEISDFTNEENHTRELRSGQIIVYPENISLGEFCNGGKINPKCIKIDFPERELTIIKNLENVLKSSLPHIIVKTYPSKLNSEVYLSGILNILLSLNYLILDITKGDLIDKETVMSSYPSKMLYLLISTKLSEKDYLKHLRENLVLEISKIGKTNNNKIDMFEIKHLANSQKHQEVIEKLSSISPIYLDAEAQYYFAFSLQMTNQNDSEVLSRYEIALRGGFAPFWIYYNRGTLYKKMGDFQHAYEDLKRAHDLDPQNEVVQTLLNSLKSVKP